MPTGKVYRNGLTMGMGGNKQPKGGPRGVVDGWSRAAVRRHTRWLYGVDTGGLTGDGYAVTLTIRDIPPTSAAYIALRRAYFRALNDSGVLLRGHWVMEWTHRKRPHMHLAIYLRAGENLLDVERLLIDTWVGLAAAYGTSTRAQHMARIDGPVGWLEYLSKHASRGVSHYQRQGKPSGWETTGRLWGHIGTWPTVEPLEAGIGRREFYRLRRLVKAWKIAQFRLELLQAADPIHRAQALRNLVYARQMLRCNDRVLSPLRGISEWMPEELGMIFLDLAAGDVEGARAASREAGAHGLHAASERPKWATPTLEKF